MVSPVVVFKVGGGGGYDPRVHKDLVSALIGPHAMVRCV